MAIQTYGDLQAAVARWTNRADLTDQIPDFIALAESALNRVLKLRVMEVEASLTVSNGQNGVDLPTDFVEPLAVWVEETWGRRPLRNIAVENAPSLTATGTEYIWSIDGARLVLTRPAPGDLPLILRYRRAFALSDADPTNWLLTHHPDAYLFGALVEAAPYLRDNDALAVWTARLNRALEEINTKEARADARATLTTSYGRMPSDRNRLHRL